MCYKTGAGGTQFAKYRRVCRSQSGDSTLSRHPVSYKKIYKFSVVLCIRPRTHNCVSEITYNIMPNESRKLRSLKSFKINS